MDDREERLEAAERTSRYYEIRGIDEPEPWTEEYREMLYIQLGKIRESG